MNADSQPDLPLERRPDGLPDDQWQQAPGPGQPQRLDSQPHLPLARDLPSGGFDDERFAETMPLRQRRPLLTVWSAALFALMLGAGGFYLGVRVEKGKLSSGSGSGSTGASAFARALSGAGGAAGTRSSLAGRFGGAGAFAGAFGAAGASAASGSVSSISGKDLYVSEAGGNTVKVKLTGQTSITKTVSVGRRKVYPGDQVVIQGVKGSGGSVTATSVTDSGARGGASGSATGTGSSSGSGSASTAGSGSSSSVISSLFGGG